LLRAARLNPAIADIETYRKAANPGFPAFFCDGDLAAGLPPRLLASSILSIGRTLRPGRKG